MEFNADKLKQVYNEWLTRLDYKDLSNQWVEITTPYTDHAGDIIQIFAHEDKDGYILTDYGYVINELNMHGISVRSGQRQRFLKRVLNANGCTLNNDNQIVVRFNKSASFPICKHRILQAIISINDLFMISANNVETIFIEDVFAYLNENGISHSSRDYSLHGDSGLPISFNLNIGKVTKYNKPTLHTRVINQFDKTSAELIILAVKDLTLDFDEKVAVVINDQKRSPDNEYMKILADNGVMNILWSDRKDALEAYRSNVA